MANTYQGGVGPESLSSPTQDIDGVAVPLTGVGTTNDDVTTPVGNSNPLPVRDAAVEDVLGVADAPSTAYAGTGSLTISNALRSIANSLLGTIKVVGQTGSSYLGRVALMFGGADVSASNPVPVRDSAVETTLGTAADVEWSGSGSGTHTAILKKISTHVSGVVDVTLRGNAGTDGSGQAIGGVSQVLFVGVVPVHGFFIQNCHATGIIYFSDQGLASPTGVSPYQSIPIYPGQLYETPLNYKPGGPVSLWGTVAGQYFIARRF